MKKILNLIKDNWNDPVWSKVIASAIVGILSIILALIYSALQSTYESMTFKDSLYKIYEYLNQIVNVKLFWILIIIIVNTIFLFNSLVLFVKSIIQKFRYKEDFLVDEENSWPNATDSSTVLFYERIAAAFPGVRGVKWFDSPREATERLLLLLKKPLRFNPSTTTFDRESDPFWWFRGHRGLHISSLKKIGRSKLIMNIEEMKIKRIAICNSEFYYKCFVYVELFGEKQTGLYNYTKGDLERHTKSFGYSSEEFGVVKGLFGIDKAIHRDEYDDGATVIKGKVKQVDAKLKLRYLTPYNFIIAAKGSPYNSVRFQRESRDYLDKILNDKADANIFFEYLQNYTRNES